MLALLFYSMEKVCKYTYSHELNAIKNKKNIYLQNNCYICTLIIHFYIWRHEKVFVLCSHGTLVIG